MSNNRRSDGKIVVMGPTGTGKSSLIRIITGDEKIIIGNELESETSEVAFADYIEPEGGVVTFVDTPGFDDSREDLTDTVILQQIAAFLEAEYKNEEETITGIIYLHRITDPKFGGTTTRNLKMFENICGPESFKNVIVVTSRWDLVDEEEGTTRERELMESPKFKPLLDGGSRFLRHDGTVESAHKIMRELQGNDPISLQIQRELASSTKLEDTLAGQELTSGINSLLEKHKIELENLKQEIESCVAEEDKETKLEVEQEIEKLVRVVTKKEEEMERLKDDLDLVGLSVRTRMEEAERHREDIRNSSLRPPVESSEGSGTGTDAGIAPEEEFIRYSEDVSVDQGLSENVDVAQSRLADMTRAWEQATEDKKEGGRVLEQRGQDILRIIEDMIQASRDRAHKDQQDREEKERFYGDLMKTLISQTAVAEESRRHLSQAVHNYKQLKVKFDEDSLQWKAQLEDEKLGHKEKLVEALQQLDEENRLREVAEMGNKNLARQLRHGKKTWEASEQKWQKLFSLEKNVADRALAELRVMTSQIIPPPPDIEKEKGPDLVIAIMGSSRKEKLLFLRSLKNESVTTDDNVADFETDVITFAHSFDSNGRRITFVDIPGFENCREQYENADILRDLAGYLKTEPKTEFSGIIYLFPITDSTSGASPQNLHLLKNLCGTEALGSVAIVATGWEGVSVEIGDRYEDEIKNDENFTRYFDAGSQIFCHDGSFTSASDIIKHFLEKPPVVLRIQQELASGMELEKTSAGAELDKEIDGYFSQQRDEVEELRRQFDDETLTDEAAKKIEGLLEGRESNMEGLMIAKDHLANGLESVRVRSLALQQFGEDVAAITQFEEQRDGAITSLKRIKEGVSAYRDFAPKLEDAAFEMQNADFWGQRTSGILKDKANTTKVEAIENFDDLIRGMLQLEFRGVGYNSPGDGAIIAVMGQTGTGKSTFIRQLTGDESISIGHSVDSETKDIKEYRFFDDNGRRVTLIDTPGFDDTNEGLSDVNILRKVASFLDTEFKDGRRLNGIIYLHRITDNRMGGTHARVMRMFEKLCGSEALKNVAVVTTRWGDLKTEAEGNKRVEQLSTNSRFMKPLADAGARFHRHTGSFGSARRIVKELLENAPVELQIQRELAGGLDLDETEAGAVLSGEMRKLMEKHETEMKKLKDEIIYLKNASHDQTWKAELEKERKNLKALIDKLSTGMELLSQNLDSVRTEIPEEKASKLQRQHLEVGGVMSNLKHFIGETERG